MFNFEEYETKRVSGFDDSTLLRMFGAQAAEDESIERLKEYFVRNKAYERLRSDIKIRLLVGHKGIGKSALLKMSHSADKEQKRLAIWLQPNDIANAWSVDGQFVERVEKIKSNLLAIIAQKCLNEFEVFGKLVGENATIFTTKQVISILLTKVVGESLNGVDAAIFDKFNKNQEIFVYVDDIDRGWSANSKDVENVSALINAVRDIVNTDERIKFRIGLRSDAYNLVRQHDESGDKFEPYRVPIQWNNHEVLVLMAKRVATFMGEHVSEQELEHQSQKKISRYLAPVVEQVFIGNGHWANRPIHNVLLSLTRRRPRDLVKLLTGAAQHADGEDRKHITSRDLAESFPEYSKGRIADLISEFGSELPQIKDVLYSMKPTTKEQKEKDKKFLYTQDEIVKKLNGIANNQNVFFAKGGKANGISLLEFLFKIDFAIARKDGESEIDRLYYQDHPNLVSNKVNFGYAWEVHPAYRWALAPSVTKTLEALEI
ncbi:MAG: hypothetical protein AAFM92_08750 [Pseudomonadota bacterium]